MSAPRRFPPRYGAPGYERVGFSLLAAMTPVALADAYNKRRGRLWVACHALRTLPKPEHFADETAELRRMLQHVWSLRADDDQDAQRDLLGAARWLDLAEHEAAAVGLLR